MKKIILSIFSLLIINSIFSQKDALPRLIGPKAKNYKPWMKPKSKVNFFEVNRQFLQGPAAKNVKPKRPSERTLKVVSTSEWRVLEGPKAKNYKPWIRKKESSFQDYAKIDSNEF